MRTFKQAHRSDPAEARRGFHAVPTGSKPAVTLAPIAPLQHCQHQQHDHRPITV